MNAQTLILKQTPGQRLFHLLTLALLLLAAGLSHADDSSDPRINATSQGLKNAPSGNAGSKIVEFDALQLTGARGGKLRSKSQQKLTDVNARAVNTDFWFYDANVELFADADRDGYYYGIDLSFDADTVYVEADVYAVVYLSYQLGPWNEYAETDVFSIYGAESGDEYFIETELISGYPTGDYDILIELYDTYDGSFVASIGPEEDTSLSFLPLEDANRDAVVEVTQVVVNSGGGGAVTWLSLLLLGALALRSAVGSRSPGS